MSKVKTNTIENVAATKSFTVDEVRAMLDGGSIGVGQTWTDVTASRSKDTDFTNNSGKPIFISVSANNVGAGVTMEIIIDGISLGRARSIDDVSTSLAVATAIIPNASVYHVKVEESPADIVAWSELR